MFVSTCAHSGMIEPLTLMLEYIPDEWVLMWFCEGCEGLLRCCHRGLCSVLKKDSKKSYPPSQDFSQYWNYFTDCVNGNRIKQASHTPKSHSSSSHCIL